MNIKRHLLSLYFKIVKAEGSPESIAKGVAIGLVCGLIIPIGLQTLPALFLAFLFKANKILSWTFTCVTNPASVFFIYPVQCWLGSYLILRPLSFEKLNNELSGFSSVNTVEQAFEVFGTMSTSIVIPFFAGGFLFAVVAAIPGYWISLRLAQRYQTRKLRKKQINLQHNKI